MKNKKRIFFCECRKRRGTQKEVADDLGITESYVRNIENGIFSPGRELMFKIGAYFGEPVEKLFPDIYQKYYVACKGKDR